jgi:hypothetical protein
MYSSDRAARENPRAGTAVCDPEMKPLILRLLLRAPVGRLHGAASDGLAFSEIVVARVLPPREP